MMSFFILGSYNVAIARFLGPIGFGHATVVYTLLTILSAVTLSFQIISAKVVAQQSSPEGKSAVYRAFHRSAWACGALAGLLVFFFQHAVSNYLNLPGSDLIAIIAVGAAFYIPLGTKRGYLQGTYGFGALATNMILEGAVRLGGSMAMILLGRGVRGVIEANAAAIAISYLAILPRLSGRSANPLGQSYVIREMMQALNFFSGQLLINNCGIVLVNHFFVPMKRGCTRPWRWWGGSSLPFTGGGQLDVSAGGRNAGGRTAGPGRDRHIIADGAGVGSGDCAGAVHRSSGNLDAVVRVWI
jgi:O-antigen/teichoic acid export membrane protein